MAIQIILPSVLLLLLPACEVATILNFPNKLRQVWHLIDRFGYIIAIFRQNVSYCLRG